MDGHHLIVWLIIGLIAGALAGRVVAGRGHVQNYWVESAA